MLEDIQSVSRVKPGERNCREEKGRREREGVSVDGIRSLDGEREGGRVGGQK